MNIHSKFLIYSATEAGVSNLWSQPNRRGQPTRLSDFKSDLIYSFDISRDGK